MKVLEGPSQSLSFSPWSKPGVGPSVILKGNCSEEMSLHDVLARDMTTCPLWVQEGNWASRSFLHTFLVSPGS